MTVTENNIQEFIRGYLTAALWSSTHTFMSEDGQTELDTVELDGYEWADGEAEKLHDECRDFIQANTDDLIAYVDTLSEGKEWDCAGHDFWFTRNGHGVGYWDRGLGELGERLTKATKAYGEVYLYLGDDELVYVGF